MNCRVCRNFIWPNYNGKLDIEMINLLDVGKNRSVSPNCPISCIFFVAFTLIKLGRCKIPNEQCANELMSLIMMIIRYDFLFMSSLLLKATFESTAGQCSWSHLADGKTGMHLGFNLLIWFLTCFVRHIF